MPRNYRLKQRTLPFLLMLTFLVGAGIGAAQGPEAGGMLLAAESPDSAMPYGALSQVSVCFVDAGGTGGYSLDDLVILRALDDCTANTAGRDVQLNVWGQGTPGGRVQFGLNQPVSAPTETATFWYHDTNGNGRLDLGDRVYLKLRNVDQPRVAVTDVRLTDFDGHAAGSVVRAGDADLTDNLILLGDAQERIRHVDIAGTNTFDAEDFLYLSRDAARSVAGPGDVRVTRIGDALPYGEILHFGSPDAAAPLTRLERNPCFADRDGTGSYTRGDDVYLGLAADCTAGVAAGDIRLTGNTYGAAGSRVVAGDGDHGASYSALSDARVGFIDDDGTGTLTRGDLVVLNLVSPGANRVETGDLLLTPTARGAGSAIGPDDELAGAPLVNLGLFRTLVVFVGIGTDNPTSGDAAYISPATETGGSLRPGHIRLVMVGPHPFGGPVGLETGEVLPRLTRAGGSVCSVGGTIPDNYQPGDGTYMAVGTACPTSVAVGMVRLLPRGGQPAFSVVRAGDSDLGHALAAPTTPVALKFFDTGGSTNTYYLDVRSPGSDVVNIGDIRLTPYGEIAGGRAVQSGDGDLNMPLTTLGPADQHLGFVDVGGDGSMSIGDYAYLTIATTAEYATIGDVRITNLPARFVSPEVPETPPTPPEGPAAPPAPPTPPGQTPTMPPDTPDDPPQTPGPAVVGVLAAIVALLALGRRRRRR